MVGGPHFGRIRVVVIANIPAAYHKGDLRTPVQNVLDGMDGVGRQLKFPRLPLYGVFVQAVVLIGDENKIQGGVCFLDLFDLFIVVVGEVSQIVLVLRSTAMRLYFFCCAIRFRNSPGVVPSYFSKARIRRFELWNPLAAAMRFRFSEVFRSCSRAKATRRLFR